MNVEVLDETAEGDSPGGVDPAGLRRLAAHVMAQMRVHPEAELAVRLVAEPEIAALNEQWMDKTGPTDVLAFPMDELRPGVEGEEPEEGILGDLMICPSVAAAQAASVRAGGDASYTTERELELLLTHGILHLLGYDHAEPDEHREMFGLQDRILAAWREPGTTA